jgi:hypothetical protein
MPIKRIDAGTGESEQTKFKCNKCSFSAKNKGAITRHYNQVHREPQKNEKPKKKPIRKVNQNQGRPSVVTPKIVAELITAFQNGLTVVQACRYSRIDKATYYRHLKSDVDFYDKMVAAQEQLNYKAREAIAKAISDGDTANARWWLERKSKDEFSTRREFTGDKGGAIKTQALIPETEVSDEELAEAFRSLDTTEN